jgi:hypothetical protein
MATSTTHISEEVRQALGSEKLYQQIVSGHGLPKKVECLICGKAIDLRLEEHSLSVMVPVPGISIPLFSHKNCGGSEIYTSQEVDRIADSRPSELIEDETSILPG